MDECQDAVAVVVASDAAAQSDIYSAVTLAGVLGSACLVDAGTRGAEPPSGFAELLDSAQAGIYVVGGTAALPDWKLDGRSVHRVWGADRFATARAVGELAVDIASGSSPAFSAVSAARPAMPSNSLRATVSAGYRFSCAIRAGGELACWGADDGGKVTGTPSGRFAEVATGVWHGCGLRTSGELACWGHDNAGQVSDAPSGTFISTAAGSSHSCAVRSDGRILCWGDDNAGQVSDAPSGTFISTAAGSSHSCAVRSDGRILCWGADDMGQVSDAPPGTFTAVTSGWAYSCGLRTNGRIVCWGASDHGEASPPSGKFATS